EAVKDITRDKKAGLSNSGFYKMMRTGDDELFQRYTHAREIQADRMAEKITEDQSIGISRSGFYYLLKGRDDELLDRYAQARAMQADRLAGEIISIADGASKDTVNQAPPGSVYGGGAGARLRGRGGADHRRVQGRAGAVRGERASHLGGDVHLSGALRAGRDHNGIACGAALRGANGKDRG
ncbi:MAG: hypothetical protein V3S20_02430, partial [Dehalococcoidia bacterium]